MYARATAAAAAAAAAAARPFAARLDHVCVGVRSLADVAPFFVRHLGAREFIGGFEPAFTGCQWKFANGAVLEALEPAGPAGGFLHRFLERRGPGVHHVTFKVSNLLQARASAESFGYEIIGYADANPEWHEFFLFPKQAGGLVVQFAHVPAAASERRRAEEALTLSAGTGSAQTPASPGPPPAASPSASGHPVSASAAAAITPAWSHRFAFPAVAKRPAVLPRVEVVGLRLRARSAERAQRQWGDLLGGRRIAAPLKDAGSALCFAFDESPMVVVVDVDPAADEGPVCVLVSSLDHAVLPPAPASIGVAFKEVFRSQL